HLLTVKLNETNDLASLSRLTDNVRLKLVNEKKELNNNLIHDIIKYLPTFTLRYFSLENVISSFHNFNKVCWLYFTRLDYLSVNIPICKGEQILNLTNLPYIQTLDLTCKKQENFSLVVSNRNEDVGKKLNNLNFYDIKSIDFSAELLQKINKLSLNFQKEIENLEIYFQKIGKKENDTSNNTSRYNCFKKSGVNNIDSVRFDCDKTKVIFEHVQNISEDYIISVRTTVIPTITKIRNLPQDGSNISMVCLKKPEDLLYHLQVNSMSEGKTLISRYRFHWEKQPDSLEKQELIKMTLLKSFADYTPTDTQKLRTKNTNKSHLSPLILTFLANLIVFFLLIPLLWKLWNVRKERKLLGKRSSNENNLDGAKSNGEPYARKQPVQSRRFPTRSSSETSTEDNQPFYAYHDRSQTAFPEIENISTDAMDIYNFIQANYIFGNIESYANLPERWEFYLADEHINLINSLVGENPTDKDKIVEQLGKHKNIEYLSSYERKRKPSTSQIDSTSGTDVSFDDVPLDRKSEEANALPVDFSEGSAKIPSFLEANVPINFETKPNKSRTLSSHNRTGTGSKVNSRSQMRKQMENKRSVGKHTAKLETIPEVENKIEATDSFTTVTQKTPETMNKQISPSSVSDQNVDTKKNSGSDMSIKKLPKSERTLRGNTSNFDSDLRLKSKNKFSKKSSLVRSGNITRNSTPLSTRSLNKFHNKIISDPKIIGKTKSRRTSVAGSTKLDGKQKSESTQNQIGSLKKLSKTDGHENKKSSKVTGKEDLNETSSIQNTQSRISKDTKNNKLFGVSSSESESIEETDNISENKTENNNLMNERSKSKPLNSRFYHGMNLSQILKLQKKMISSSTSEESGTTQNDMDTKSKNSRRKFSSTGSHKKMKRKRVLKKINDYLIR
ncbi:hypothetical protein SNEBB_009354, partial [Seison nebaliae]